MFRNLFLFAVGLLIGGSGYAQTEMLRHFDPSNATYAYPSGFNLLVARFEPQRPGLLTGIRVKLGGTQATGSAEMTVFGHEGGTSFPQLEKPLFPFVPLNKSAIGEEWIEYRLPVPIRLQNNQFFIAFRNLKNGARIYADNKPAAASCKSASGGDYYYIFLKTTSNTWSLGNKLAFAVEAEMQYDPPLSIPRFKEVTAAAGIDTNQGNAVVCWADLDGDGFQDLLTQSYVYQNIDGKSFADRTQSIGYGGSNGALILDVDNDGNKDILAFYPNGDSGTFFKNTGNFTFKRIKASGLKALPSLSSFSAADLDKDGFPEVFTGQLWGAYPEPYPNYLFKNHGDGTFSDITSGLYPMYDGKSNFPQKTPCKASDQSTWLSNGNTNRRSRGSAFVDFDNDGDQDLYVTNYFLEPDEFFRNNGDGTFTDVQNLKGIDKNLTGSNHGTGVDFGDYNNDGYFDLLLPQFSHPAFALLYDHRNTTVYRNAGPPDYAFTDLNPNNEMIQPPSGLAFEETYAGGSWGDVNSDGFLDVYMSVFYGCRYVKLFLQKPDHTFELSTHLYGLQKLNTGEDATWVDYNNDGKPDLASGNNGRFRLFENRDAQTGNYLSFDLKAASGNRQALGSRIVVYAGGQKLTRQITAGRGVRHQSPYRQIVGLGRQTAEKVEVYWPDGNMELFTGFTPNRHYTIEQGKPVEGLMQESTDLRLLSNPGNQTQIRWMNQYEGTLSLRVYDATGRLVATLADEKLAAGLKIFPLESLQVSGGIYWVQAVFEGRTHAVKWLKTH